MNEQEQRAAIAGVCGWTHFVPGTIQYTARRPDGKWDLIPDYLSDRNAMIDALSVLSSSQRIDLLCSLERQGVADDWALLTAEPKAIAQAFLETLNIWTE